MAEHHLPELDAAARQLGDIVEQCAASLRDFKAALDSSDLPETILDEYESRQLLRTVSEDDSSS